jgi:hypothetical protein
MSHEGVSESESNSRELLKNGQKSQKEISELDLEELPKKDQKSQRKILASESDTDEPPKMIPTFPPALSEFESGSQELLKSIQKYRQSDSGSESEFQGRSKVTASNCRI